MKLNEVLTTLKERGHPLTRASLYRAGLKNGFLTKSPYGKTTRYIIDEAKFNVWLDKAVADVPDGFYSIKDVCKRLEVSYCTVRAMCERHEIESISLGAGKGIVYVRYDEVKDVIGIHKQNN